MNTQEQSRGVPGVLSAAVLLTACMTSLAQVVDEELFMPAADMEAPFELLEFTRNPNAAEAHANNVVVYRAWDGPALINGIPPGFRVIDGDIVVPAEADGQTAAAYSTSVWPGGRVPYEFDANVTMANAQAMIAAMAEWESVAAIDFIPRSGEASFIHIQNNSFNNSRVGNQVFGQIINITNWDQRFVIAHELGHALGYWHEQSRGDRDTYVTINTVNICQNCCQQSDGSMGSCNFNFRLEDTSSSYGPYDFDSVMHYGRCFFSTNGAVCSNTCPALWETLSVKDPYRAEWHCGSPPADNTFVGQQTHLSYWDKVVMSFIYPRPNWRFQSSVRGADFFNASFFTPLQSFSAGYAETPVGGTLWMLDPSTIAVGPVLNKPMTIGAPLGGVTLTR